MTAKQLDSENPWPGLDSFEENAHAFFHGRDREAAKLLEHVLDAPVTVLYGRSGLGKTSLLQAGLFPLLRDRPVLRDRRFLPVYVRFELKPGAAPLSRQLHQLVDNSIRAGATPDSTLPSDEESLWEYLHRADFKLWSAKNYPLTPVIVLDQFEELFTIGEQVSDQVRTFMNDLGDLAENRTPADLAKRIEHDETVAERFNLPSHNYKLLISLREDFLPDLEEWRRRIPTLGRSRMRLVRLRGYAALDAVRKPASDLMSGDLPERVVRIVAGEELHRGRDTAPADVDHPIDDLEALEVEPALLSLFCRELNEERKHRGQAQFDEQLVEDAKRDILSNYYSSCVRDLPPRVAHFIENELITEKGFRDNYAREDAVPSQLSEDELARLIDSRLLRLEDRYGAQRIELTHDVLSRVVRERRDRRRAEEEKAALAARAEELEAEKQHQQAALDAAQQHATALRKRSRILGAVLAVTVIIAVLAVYLYVRTNIAQQQAKDALQKFHTSLMQKMIAEAHGMLAGTQPGGDIRAFQEILAVHSLARDNAIDGDLYTAVAERASTLKILIGHAGAVSSVAFSRDGHRLATAGADHTVRLWNADTGRPIGDPLTGHTGAVYGVAFSPDGHRLATAGADHTVRLWNADTRDPVLAPLTGHTAPVNAVAFSPDGHRVASGCSCGSVRLWNADTGQPIGDPLTGHTAAVYGVAFSPDGHRLATAGGDQTVRLWNADTGQLIGDPLKGHTDAVYGVAFSPDGHRLATAGADHTVRLWNADTGQLLGDPLTGHTDTVNAVAFSPDGHRLATAGADQTVRLWNADTGQPVGDPLTGHTDAVYGVAFSPDGHRLATASADQTVRLWNADAGQPGGDPLNGHTGTVNGVAFSPDGHRLATSSFDTTVRLWNADTGQPIGNPLTGHTDAVYGVAFSPDGHRLATASADHTVRLWNADTGQPIGDPLTGHTDAVYGVAFSPDGHRLATASADQTVRLWNADTGQLLGDPLTGHTAAVNAVAFSPDGHRLATASADHTVRRWNADTGQPVGDSLTGHTDAVYGVAFSPDGHRLATAGADQTVRLWNADTGQPGDSLTGHTDAVYAVAFNPDGQLLATAGADRTVRLWNADTGQPVGDPLTGHTDAIYAVAFSPDGHRLATTSRDRTVRLWQGDASPDMLCAKLTANMSRQQWREWVTNEFVYRPLCEGLPIPADEGSR